MSFFPHSFKDDESLEANKALLDVLKKFSKIKETKMATTKDVKISFDLHKTEIKLRGNVEIPDSDHLYYDFEVTVELYDDGEVNIVEDNYDFQYADTNELGGMDDDKIMEAIEEPIKNYARGLYAKLSA